MSPRGLPARRLSAADRALLAALPEMVMAAPGRAVHAHGRALLRRLARLQAQRLIVLQIDIDFSGRHHVIAHIGRTAAGNAALNARPR